MRRVLGGVWLTLVVLTGCGQDAIPPEVGSLAANELFFSEYVEGSSNNKALEIYNGTAAAVDLKAGGYNVQMYFNGASSPSLTINLTGNVGVGDVFVLAQSSANPTVLAQADQTNSAGWFNGDDAIVLRKGMNVLDVIGQIGFDPGSEWGAGLTSTADNTLRRKATVCAGDTNGSDAFNPADEWNGFASDTFGGLGSHTADCGAPAEDVAPTVASTNPADDAVGVAVNSTITLTFSEPVNVADGGISLSCGAQPRAAVLSGEGTTFTLDPTENFTQNETCTVTVSAAAVTDQDGAPQPLEKDYTFSFTTELGTVLIHQIQGTGPTSPLVNQVVTVEAVVTAVMPGLNGFYVQEELENRDDDLETSEGVFVFTGSGSPILNQVAVGDTVNVTGTVGEYVTSGASQTQIAGDPRVTRLERAPVLLEPVKTEFPLEAITDMERYEGMLVTFAQRLVISEYFNYDRFGEVTISLPLPGEDRQYTPTSVVAPGPEANELLLTYLRSRITLDDGRSVQNPFPARHPDGSVFSVSNSFRGGDILENATGVIDHTFGLYRVQPTTGADYTSVNPRPAQPDDVGGRMSVASFNVLNYFTTVDTGARICGPSRNLECRGADNETELERQRTKILAALAGLDADVVGLIEIENTAGVEAEADLIAGLNERLGTGTYAYLQTGTIGTDAIKLALIYKPAAVTPLGDYAILDGSVDSRFDDGRNRPVLAQTFMENATGARVTVAVNHLKSKGSACGAADPDRGDGQGNCNLTRTRAAQALAAWLADDPTDQGESDAFIVGDLNSYAQEDPIRALVDAGYTDLIDAFHDPRKSSHPYGYAFDGLFGYLDHALSSASLRPQVTGATEWHINADEPDILDYDTQFNNPSYYAPDPYRSSDHDAVLVGAALTYTPTETFAALRYFVAQYVSGGNLRQAQASSLLDKLAAAEAALARGQVRVALNQVGAFENQVRAFTRASSLSTSQEQALLDLSAALRRLF